MKTPSLFLLALLFCINGCDKNSTNPSGPSLTGYLKGVIDLWDEEGNRINDRSGVTVSISSRSLSTMTNAAGQWSLGSLQSGTFEVGFSKPGFGIYKIPTLQFVGGGDYYIGERSLIQLPTFTVDSLSAIGSGTMQITVSGKTSRPDKLVVLFFGANGNVSANPSDYIFYELAGTYSQSQQLIVLVGKVTLSHAGVASGTTLFVRAYPNANFLWITYPDTSTGREYFSSISTVGSNIASVTVP